MEDGLLVKERLSEKERILGCGVIVEEMKRVGYLAGPMVAVTLSFYLLQVITTVMVGHLGELSLSSTAIAISLVGVTGWSPLLGMAGALETLSGQAYGAEQYERIGTQTYTAIFSLLVACIPISILWIYMGDLLILLGQDPEISHEAGKFIVWLVPALFGYAALQPLVRYFQMQSLVTVMLISSCITICFHTIVCWLLVFRSGMGSTGAAVSMDLAMWVNVFILGFYMKYSSKCEKTRVRISMRIFDGVGEFFKLAIPSSLMICLEWWSYELVILMSGLMTNPQLETSVLSVCLNTIFTLYAIPFGLSAAASTRISNELGAGNPREARIALIAMMLLAGMNAIIMSSSLFASRNVFGYIFSDEKEVVDYVSNMAPLLCLNVIIDNVHGTLSGVARGCGWQDIGAYINLGAFYLFGIPIAGILSFWYNFRGRGLWIGILSGCTMQALMLVIVTSCTNWQKEAEKAKERLALKESYPVEGLLA